MASLTGGIRPFLIIGLIAAISALLGLFTLPPLDRDESRFAQATAQMLETGNFVEINFLDTERNKKPIGIHWLQVVTVGALSDAEAREIWAYRIPSLIGVILAALAAFWGGQKLIGREAAFVGASLFAATVLLGIEGGIAKTDAMLAGATTLAMAALANLRTDPNAGRKTVMLFWFAIGLGTLIKGPVTPMVAGLTGLMLVIWERKASWLKRLLFIPGPLLAILMVLPWLVAIQIATDGNFLREALGDDLGPKLVSSHERHGGPIGYHLFLLPLLFFPAVLYLVPGIAKLVGAIRGEDDKAARAARFLVAWIIPTWLVFEILPTKLPHYVLPVYPALALAVGWAMTDLANSKAWQRWTSRGLFIFAGIVFAILAPVALAIYGSGASWDAIRLTMAGFTAGFEIGLDPVAMGIVGLATALFAGLSGAALMMSFKTRSVGPAALLILVLSGLAWQGMIRGAVVPNAHAMRLADQVRAAREYAPTITGLSADEIVTASGYTEPSLVFSLGSDTYLGTAVDVMSRAASREDPTLVVLDLSRDPWLTGPFIDRDVAPEQVPQSVWDNPVDALTRLPGMPEAMPNSASARSASANYFVYWAINTDVCHASLASGTNYSRGDETVLLLAWTRCGDGRVFLDSLNFADLGWPSAEDYR